MAIYIKVQICALLGCYAPSSSRVRKSWTFSPWNKMGPIRYPETSVKDYHSTLRIIPEEHRSHQNRGGKPEKKPIKVISP
jgi:hypothetical protein